MMFPSKSFTYASHLDARDRRADQRHRAAQRHRLRHGRVAVTAIVQTNAFTAAPSARSIPHAPHQAAVDARRVPSSPVTICQ